MKEVLFEKSEALLRLNEVLRRFPVSKSSWWLGVKERRYPAPVKIGRRAVAWSETEINNLIRECCKPKTII
jgi:predicted DNA-binding transcriptional regulator AlpA